MQELKAEIRNLAARTENLDETVRGNRAELAVVKINQEKSRRNQFVLAAIGVLLILGLAFTVIQVITVRNFLCDTTAVLSAGNPSTANGVRVQEQTREVRGRYGC